MWFRSCRSVTPSAIESDFAVELQRALADELQDDRRNEELGHAPDPETVIRRQEHRHACRPLPGETGAGSDSYGARDARSHDRL